jgi:hypothetical protein
MEPDGGRYDNPIPTLFLAPINCFKIPALLALRFKCLIPGVLSKDFWLYIRIKKTLEVLSCRFECVTVRAVADAHV